jgi:hypothetical protein
VGISTLPPHTFSTCYPPRSSIDPDVDSTAYNGVGHILTALGVARRYVSSTRSLCGRRVADSNDVEVRNRIYDSALKPSQHRLQPRLNHTSDWFTSRSRVSSWKKLDRKTLGLTQTRRQLRDEFLPLDQRSTEVTIDLPVELATWYFEDFIPDPARAMGVLRIHLQEHVIWKPSVIPPGYGQLLPLIRLCQRAPHLTVKFTSKTRQLPVNNLIQPVLDSYASEKGQKFILDTVPSIRYNVHLSVLEMHVHEKAQEEWIP